MQRFTPRTTKWAAVVALSLALGFGAGYVWRGRTLKQPDFSSLGSVYSLLKSKYDGNVDSTKALQGAKAGLVASAGDPYTVYMTAEEIKQLNDDLSGTVSGIGAEIAIKNNRLLVVSPVADSPAARAGLKPQDQIAKINDEDPTGLSLDEAVSKIRGAEGTEVRLTIVRGSTAPFEVTIKRAIITVPSVKWSQKPNGIGYIQITRFGPDTTSLMTRAATELVASGSTKIILDLRNDPGGYLDAAVAVAGQFVDKKLVVEERHNGKSVAKHTSDGNGLLVGKPTIVLINGGSASASEIVAGALHDNHAATLLGEKSFGKGSVQEIDNLSDGSALKVTIAHWFTPDGVNISKEGIKPDTEVKLEAADSDAGRDPQLDRATRDLQAR